MSIPDRADGAAPSHPERPQQNEWIFVEGPSDGEANDTSSREEAPVGPAFAGNALVIGETSAGKSATLCEFFAQALARARAAAVSGDLRPRQGAHRDPAKPA
jgi:hypothetical protein